jgi:hypothetical protein
MIDTYESHKAIEVHTEQEATERNGHGDQPSSLRSGGGFDTREVRNLIRMFARSCNVFNLVDARRPFVENINLLDVRGVVRHFEGS